MNQDYPVPPAELLEQWRYAASNVPASSCTDPGGRRDYIDYIATQAARWGADQALEAIGVPTKIGEARVIENPEHEQIRRAVEALIHTEGAVAVFELIRLGMEALNE